MSSAEKQEFDRILNKYYAGDATPQEENFLEAYYHAYSLRPGFITGKDQQYNDQLFLKIKEHIDARINTHQHAQTPAVITNRKIRKPALYIRWAVAASIVLCFGVYFFINNHDNNRLGGNIIPGRNTATLTLANGETLSLSEAKKGLLINTMKDAGVLTYTDGTPVNSRYPDELAAASPSVKSNMLTVTTPMGGTYQVILPDGTKVWLNAASKLRFPSTFTQAVTREVELISGEAYFEVAKIMVKAQGEKKKEQGVRLPFIVAGGRQKVEVLGTHFNINNYADEGSIKTTLLEGAVRVYPTGINSVVLRPGQQSLFADDKLKIQQADVEQAIAWKNGLFYYNNTPMQSVMRQIARWYNVEIVYQSPDLKDKILSGSVSRYDSVSKILKAIEYVEAARFEVKGRRITVMKYE